VRDPERPARSTRINAFAARNSAVMPPYFASMTCAMRAIASGSETKLALPSTTTGSSASSVVTTQRGSAARLRALRDRGPLLNHTASPSHTAQTGIECGRPSGHRLVIQ
jgi:hypothetical protein